MKNNKEIAEYVLKSFAGILLVFVILTITAYATTTQLNEQKKQVEQKCHNIPSCLWI